MTLLHIGRGTLQFSDVRRRPPTELIGRGGAGLPVALEGSPGPAPVPEVGARAAKAMVDAGAFLLNVREPDEWRAGHVAESTLVPIGQVHARLGELPPDRRIVVVCRSGGRWAAVTQSLRASAFDTVNLSGGLCAWAAAGLPVEVDADSTGR